MFVLWRSIAEENRIDRMQEEIVCCQTEAEWADWGVSCDSEGGNGCWEDLFWYCQWKGVSFWNIK